MDNFYVYMYLRTNSSKHGEAGSPYYIGKGKGHRVLDSNRHIPRPTDTANIVFFATDLTEWDAHQLEMLLIHRFGRIDLGTGSLRNLTDGGEGQSGRIQPEDEKRRKSEWMKANPNRGNAVCPKWPKGKPRSEETKAKQSASMKGKPAWNKGKNIGPAWNKGIPGKPHSEETKLKMTEAQKRRWKARHSSVTVDGVK
jgi:hypothetical protein